MEVICNNCNGRFDDSEDKCPYCGMIYEPGAEKKYNEKLDNIRKNLDEVDRAVVGNVKDDLKRFFKAFFICLVISMIICGIVILVNIKGNKNKRQFAADEMHDMITEAISLNNKFNRWNKLYESGDYELMCGEVSESVIYDYNGNYGSWKHYRFFNTYSKYVALEENFNSIEENKCYGSYVYSSILYNLFNIYCELYVNEYSDLSYSDREILEGCYAEACENTKKYLSLSNEEFEELQKKLVTRNTTYVGNTECEKIAEERIGDRIEVYELR